MVRRGISTLFCFPLEAAEPETDVPRPSSRTRLSTPPAQTAASTRASKRHSGASSAPSDATSEQDLENGKLVTLDTTGMLYCEKIR